VTTSAPVYTVDDLGLARERLGTPHVELDPWGNLVVTPASDPHEYAIHQVDLAIDRALSIAGIDAQVYVDGPPWRVPGGSGYLNQPDLTVLSAGTRRAGADGLHWTPAPLLVVEVASPSTRVVDRSRKRADHLLGGAAAVWLVDLPALTPVAAPAVTVVYRDADGDEREAGTFTGLARLDVPFGCALNLDALELRGRWA